MGRLILAFVLAPVVAALLFGSVLSAYLMVSGAEAGPSLVAGIASFLGGVAFGAPITLIVGVPAYRYLRWRLPFRWWWAVAAGAGVAALGWILWVAAFALGDEQPPATVLLTRLATALPLGAVGGLVFWLVAEPVLRRES